MIALTIPQPYADLIVAWQHLDWWTVDTAPPVAVVPGIPAGRGAPPLPVGRNFAIVAAVTPPEYGAHTPAARVVDDGRIVVDDCAPVILPTGAVVGTARTDGPVPVLDLYEDRSIIDRAAYRGIPHIIRTDHAIVYVTADNAVVQIDTYPGPVPGRGIDWTRRWAYPLHHRTAIQAVTPPSLPTREIGIVSDTALAGYIL